jgi:Zn-dependent protease with chaperone function
MKITTEQYGVLFMFSARIFMFLVLFIRRVYNLFLLRAADEQRKKPLPAEVADIYEPERYQTYLDYVADTKRVQNKYKIINTIVDCILIFSPIYGYIENISGGNPYISFLIMYAIIWLLGLVTETGEHYEFTFGVKEKYGLNKKDKREFAKDEVISNVLETVVMLVFVGFLIYIGEHMAAWTDNFSIGLLKSAIICGCIFAIFFIISKALSVFSYIMLRKRYVFTPMEEGELKDKIWKLQEGSKKKVKEIYVYNESKKSTSKNAFLLKLFWHREFGIADNFLNENDEAELLAVLSHETGHLKHKKDIWDFINYGISAILMIVLVCIVANPQVCLWINAWIRDSFGITTNNYYLTLSIYGAIITPVNFITHIYDSYRSRRAEYEADREAVKNGYGEELISTFKNMSTDELINVNPHPFIEFTEYSHPGMYRRIKAIREGIRRVEEEKPLRAQA